MTSFNASPELYGEILKSNLSAKKTRDKLNWTQNKNDNHFSFDLFYVKEAGHQNSM